MFKLSKSKWHSATVVLGSVAALVSSMVFSQQLDRDFARAAHYQDALNEGEWGELRQQPLRKLTARKFSADANSAYVLFLYYQDCKSAPRSEEDIERMLRDMRMRIESAENAPPASSEGAADEMRAMFEYQRSQDHESLFRDKMEKCEGVSAADAQSRSRYWIGESARLGNMHAMVMSYALGWQDLTSTADFIQSPTRIDEFRNKSLSLLVTARNLGSMDALYYLGEVYEQGIIVDKSLPMAYANYSIWRDHTEAAESLLRLTEERMSPAELILAAQLEANIRTQISCNYCELKEQE